MVGRCEMELLEQSVHHVYCHSAFRCGGSQLRETRGERLVLCKRKMKGRTGMDRSCLAHSSKTTDAFALDRPLLPCAARFSWVLAL